MATRILPIPPNPDDEAPQFSGERHAYTFGGCGLFALALQRITGWPLVSYDTCQDLFVHMGVQEPDGTIWDARGQHKSVETFIAPFGTMIPENGFRPVTFDELCAYAPSAANWPLDAAERHASMMFPKLLHLPTSDRSRTVAFMDDVERLSQRFNAWIMADRDAIHRWPIIGEDFEEIAGYRTAHNKGIVTMDRALQSDVGRGPTHLPRRIGHFLQELTALSRQHKLWIRAGGPMLWPRLEQLDETEQSDAHYDIRQTDNAGGFLTNLAR